MKRSPPQRKPARHSAARSPLHASAHVAESTQSLFDRLALLLSALFAGTLLFMVFGPHRIGDYFTETDFYGAYAEGARMLQRGHVDAARYGVVGPVYELVLALVGFVVRDLFLAAELISVAAMSGALWLWYRIVRRVADARVALGAAAVLATNSYFFRYGYASTTDALALCLQALALWLLLGANAAPASDAKPGFPRAAFLAGVIAALAFLTRYSAVVLLPAGVAIALWGGWRDPVRRRSALVFALGFALTVLPWLIFCLASGAKFSFQLHHNIAYEVFARARGITWDDYQRTLQSEFHSLGDVIARDPGAVFSRMLFNAWDHVRLDATKLVGLPVVIAAGLGVLFAIRERRLAALAPIGVALLLGFLALVPAFHSERYSLAVLPAWALLAGVALGGASWAIPIRVLPGSPWLKAALAIVPLALATKASWGFQRHALSQLPTEVLQAAETLKPLVRPGDRMIARKPHLAFYGGVEPLPFPFADSLPTLAAETKRQHARWIWFSWPEAETRPGLFYLLDSASVVPGLTQRKVTHPHPGILYEVGPEFGVIPDWMRNDTTLTYHLVRGRLMVNGEDGQAWYGLAVVERARGNLAQARRAARNAARFEKDKLASYLMLGTLSLDVGDAAEARAAFTRALPLEPGQRRARLGLGWSYLIQDDFSHAATEWRRVIDGANDPLTLSRMLFVFRQVGDAEAVQLVSERLARLGVRP